MKIEIIKNEIINNNKGNILKFIKKSSKEFLGFGECYFSEIKKKTKKGWRKNITTFQMISVIVGKVKFNLIDEKKNKKIKYSFVLDNKKNFNKIIIPKGVWYSFENLSKEKSILFNFLNVEHNKTKMIRTNFKI